MTTRNRSIAEHTGRESRLSELCDAEIRAQQNDGDPIGFTGTAAVFNTRAKIGSSVFGWFEEVRDGSFVETISDDDIRMLKNHNTDLPLARNTAGSLRLEERKKGLGVDADMDPVSYAFDLAKSIERKTVTQMSIGFEVLEEEWITLADDDPDKGKVVEPELRVIKKVKLWEVSPVTFPAYTDTEAGLRLQDLDALAQRFALDEEKREALAVELRTGNPNEESLRALVAPPAPATTPEPVTPTGKPRLMRAKHSHQSRKGHAA